MSNVSTAGRKRRIKLLKACAGSQTQVITTAGDSPDNQKFKQPNGATMTMPQGEMQSLMREGLIVNSGESWKISEIGRMHLKRLLSEVDMFQSQHREIVVKTTVDNGQPVQRQFNESESPLSRLRFRYGKKGKPYIDEICFQAGERLRTDFTRANLTRQISSNWNMVTGDQARSGHRNGMGNITDAALSARIRMEKAMEAVGPEFSGVLVDICCFLKGLELVERERQWPPRSAKLMLKTGLSVLARHYGLGNRTPGSAPTRNWGDESYRPAMFMDDQP